jgi:endonuclease G
MKSALLFLLLSTAPVAAAQSSCPQFFEGATAPDILKQTLSVRTAEICYSDFAVMHSGVTAGPLWSAEHLTADGIVASKQVARVDRFFAEKRLPAADRAELEHYRGSGYDRGHMSPSADMTSDQSQAESFSLANMVPQNPSLNRKLWANIESTTRGLALSYGEVYVVSGPAFVGGQLKRIGGRVLVPTATFKAVFVPSQNAAAAWWANNDGDGNQFEVISLEELASRLGIDVFPSVPEGVKTVAARLPAPKAGADAAAGTRPHVDPRTTSSTRGGSDGWGTFFGHVATDVVRKMMK